MQQSEATIYQHDGLGMDNLGAYGSIKVSPSNISSELMDECFDAARTIYQVLSKVQLISPHLLATHVLDTTLSAKRRYNKGIESMYLYASVYSQL